MTDTNQKLREAFEARMTDNGKWPRAVEQGRNGCYLLAQTENAWAEWQACAEALALPTTESTDAVAWIYELAVRIDSGGNGVGWNWHVTQYKPQVPENMIRSLRRLTYTDTTQPTTQAQEQELMRVEIAGLSSTISHLSKLLDEQRALLVETEDVCGRDVYGAQFEDGDSSLIDKIRAHLAMTEAPDTEVQPGLFQDSVVIPKPNAQDHLPDAGKMLNGLTQSETDASASVSGLTAAPVGEHELPPLPVTSYQLYYQWSDDEDGCGGSEVVDGDAYTADQMRAYALSARAALRAGDAGWQPIETAPKDGRTMLLGGTNSCGKWRTMRGQWMSQDYIDQNWEDPEAGEPGWFETCVEADEVPNCWPIEPTHWMPIPPAPAMRKDNP